MLKRKKPKLTFLILLLTLVFALVARFIALGKIPWGLYWDEIAMYVDIKSLLVTGKDIHGLPWHQLIFPSYGDYKAPVYLWLAWLAAKFFGLSEFSLRLTSALAGSLTVFLAGAIGLKLLEFGKAKPGHNLKIFTFLSVPLVVAFSPWSFMFSRTAFEGHLSQFFLALAVYLLLLFEPLDKLRRFWLIPAWFLGILSIYTYYSTRYVWLVVALAVISIKFIQTKKKSGLAYLTSAILLVVFSLLALVPLKNSPFYNASQNLRFSTSSIIDAQNTRERVLKSNRYRQLAGNTKLDRVFFHRDLFLLDDLGKNLSANLSLNNLFLIGDSNLRHGTGLFGLFLISFLPFFFIGLYQLAKENRPSLVLVIVWWLVALLPASVPNEVPHALRSLNALMPLSLLIGFGLATSFDYLTKKETKLHTNFLTLGLSLVLILNFVFFIDYYFKHYPLASASSWQVGYKELANLVYKYRKDQEPVVVLAPDDRFYLWLMGYGPYKGNEFAGWSEKDFKKENFDDIYFNQAKQKALALNKKEGEYLVAGDQSKVIQFINRNKFGNVVCFLSETGNEGEIEPMVCKVHLKININD